MTVLAQGNNVGSGATNATRHHDWPSS